MQINRSRRDFLATLSAAGATSIVGARKLLADEAPPEVTTVRLVKQLGVCTAPQELPRICCVQKASRTFSMYGRLLRRRSDRPGGRGHRA